MNSYVAAWKRQGDQDAEIARLRGIIARNARQRLADDEMHILPEDITASLEILYAEQEKKSL